MSLALYPAEKIVATPAEKTPHASNAPALMQVRVQSIHYGTHDTHLYELEPTQGIALPPAEPGAHIALHLPAQMVRQYSLLRHAERPARYAIGVKRDPSSRGGSRYIHEALRVGDLIDIEPPRNNFPLQQDAKRTLLIAGGIGITPMLCMWKRLRDLGREVRLVYACRSRRDALFLDEIAHDPSVTLRFDDEHDGAHLDIESLLADLDPRTHLYCCGPTPMLRGFEALAQGWPAAQVHVEYFSASQEQATAGGFVLKLARSDRAVPVSAGQTILQALRDAGVDTPSSCEEGICGACEVKVLSGVPDHRDAVLSQPERDANDKMMICCSGSKTPELVIDL